jgi:mannosyltransferase
VNRRRAIWLILLLILALAAFLRFYRIGAQSLWNDEGTSAALALRDLATITESAGRDIHPPLYYWLLHFWVNGFGASELALRSLSALLGIALVGLVFLTGESLFGAEVGLLAAFLSAVSPFQVYYSQETRMYMLLTAVAALGTYALVRFLRAEHPPPRSEPASRLPVWAAIYGVAVVLGLYTHYSFPLLWGVWNLTYLAFWLWSRRGLSCLLRWIAIQAAAFVFYLPWLPAGLRQMQQWPAISEAHSLPFFVKDAFQLFLGGHSLALARSDLLILMAALGVVLLVGLLPITRRTGLQPVLPWWLRTGLIAAWLAVPILAQWALSLWRPAYRPKFFLAAAPAFALLIAKGALWSMQKGGSRKFGRLWRRRSAGAEQLLLRSCPCS